MTLAPGSAITNLWNGALAGSSGAVTVANESYNGAVPAGGTLTFGFQATSANNPPTAPGSWTLNGHAC